MSVNSKMTAIADEIRELSGTTGAMGLDAMATHIGEANTDVATQTELLAQIIAALEGKADGGDLTPIIDALTEKGVEVSEGTNITGLAELIAAIETTEEVTTVSGTITPVSETNAITIEHNLGKIPQYFLLFRSNGMYSSDSASDKIAFPATAAQTVLSVILAGGKLFYVVGYYSGGEYAMIAYKKIDDIDSSMYFNYITINESIISFELNDSNSVFRTKKYVWEAMG